MTICWKDKNMIIDNLIIFSLRGKRSKGKGREFRRDTSSSRTLCASHAPKFLFHTRGT